MITDITIAVERVAKICKDIGLKEWTESLDEQTIPSNRLDELFQLDVESFSGAGNNQNCQKVSIPITVRMYSNCSKKSFLLRAHILKRVQELLIKMLDTENRLNNFLDIKFDTTSIEQLPDSKGMKASVSFVCTIPLKTK
jgi:hypothetical protein